jgi:isopentenyl-diphosphate delta-isomerase type 1
MHCIKKPVRFSEKCVIGLAERYCHTTFLKTTDPQDEIFDIVDSDDRVIGTATRKAVHNDKKLIHRAVDILVFKGKKLLLQKRSSTKDMYPNCWTVSCSGHVSSGDSYEETVRRELNEELGITPGKVDFITKTIIDYPNETEYVSYYKTTITDDQEIIINTEEISDYAFYSLSELNLLNTKHPVTPDFSYILPYCLRTQ